MIVLDVRLKPFIKWPEREELWRTMPQCFQYSFGKKTTVITRVPDGAAGQKTRSTDCKNAGWDCRSTSGLLKTGPSWKKRD